ncbi:MAG: lytic transglycosylase domain-containing protein, partial [Actinobacteria bacterium]|nr:lytic transglycosylase domain-containing protein [Actinomycetota bacterium]
AQRAAAEKAAAQKAAAQKAAQQQTTQQAAVTTASGSPQQIAQQLLDQEGEGSQFSCLDQVWQKESGWSTSAQNASSGAYGIPQALPGSKMASAGPDWQTNAETQIKWGLQYIKSTYGTPCGALAHEQSSGWY